MTKKIVHIIIGLGVGGAELMLKRLVLNSSKKGQFEHVIISLTDLGVIGPELQNRGITVYSLGMKSLTTLPLIFLKLQKLLKKIQPDVVQTWMYHSDLLGGLAAKSLGIENIIWGIRNTGVGNELGISRIIIRKLCAKLSYVIPSSIVCVAHKAKETHVNIGYDESKMKVIPNGFDLNKFIPDKSKRLTMRSSLKITDECLVIGNIGRFALVKNQLNFIKACIILIEKGYDFKVLIGGRNTDMNNVKVRDLFVDNNHVQYFTFLGEIKDTSSFYNVIDIFCLCSYNEGFPNVLGEAMATENVCLATDAGDAQLILDRCGFNIESTDYMDIAQAIEYNIFKGSETELKDIAKRSRIIIQKKYSLNKIVSDFEKLYIK